jgi:ubiquitin C-terminal hydrolase
MEENIKYKESKNQNNMPNQRQFFGKIGLPNLGNTCYINSCIQALSQIFLLSKFFLSNKYKNYINYNNHLGSNGTIVKNYAEIINVLWYNSKVKLIKLNSNNKIKSGYYYDQENNIEIKTKMNNLFNSIVKNNSQYGYSQNDCIEFMIYFIDILHEDLKNMKIQKELLNNSSNCHSTFELFKTKWKIYKTSNNSIMTTFFYGMFNTIISCPNCYNNINNFEAFNVIHLPIFQIIDERPKKDEIKKFKIGLLQKENKQNIPNKNAFQICKCIILPFNLNKERIQINIPIFKKQFNSIQFKIINKIIFDLLKEEDLIPTILTDNKCDIKIIIEEKTYFYQIFKSFENLEIYYIQISNKELNLNLIKNMNNEELFEKISYFNLEKKIKNKSSQNNFLLGEDLSSYQSIIENDYSENSNSKFNILKEKSLNSLNEKENEFFSLKALNICFINENQKQYQFPRIFKLTQFSTLIELYNLIYSYFIFNFSKLKKNNNLNANNNMKFFEELEDDLSEIKYLDKYNYFYYLDKNPNLKNSFPFPFVLNFKFIKKKEKKEIYIPIPFSYDLFYNYVEKLNNYNKSNDFYQYTTFSIYIIWFENYYNYLNILEKNIKRENILIDPYLELENNNSQKINSIKNDIQKNNLMNNLYDLIDNYVDFQYYDRENTYHCDNCNKDVIGYQYIEFYYLPNIIIFHLQKKHDNYLYKIPVEFPINEYLDLSKYNKGEQQENKYELISIINFSGNKASGHYNIYCKHHFEKKWYLFNDTVCFIVDDLKKEIKYEDVYAVIYKRINFNDYNIE